MKFRSLTAVYLLTLTNGFNLTYPVANTTITVHPDSNFTVRWTSLPSDPEMVNIRIQADSRGGNPEQLCTNITTSTNHCDVPGESVDFDNGPDWEMVVINSADPGTPDTPGTGEVIFKSAPFALYLYGSSASSTLSTPSETAMSTSTVSGGGGLSSQVGKVGAMVAGIAAILL